ncbi:MAG: hypothetical protein ACREIA_18530 [Opitutaceae bacterium]
MKREKLWRLMRAGAVFVAAAAGLVGSYRAGATLSRGNTSPRNLPSEREQVPEPPTQPFAFGRAASPSLSWRGDLRTALLTPFENIAVEAVLVDLPLEQFKEVALYILSLPEGSDKNTLLRQLLQNWMARDRNGALNFVATLKGDRLYKRAASVVVREMVAASPEDAFSFIVENHAGPLAAALQRIGILELAESDPVAAWRRARELPCSYEQVKTLERIAKEYVRDDPAAALAWARKLPLGFGRNAALVQALSGVAATDPEQAAALLDGELVVTDGFRTGLAATVAEAWVQKNPGRAIEWILEQPNGESVLAPVLAKLAESDPANAASVADVLYTNQLTEQHAPEIISSVAVAWAKEDPQAASAWLQVHPINEATRRAASQIYLDWMAVDPAAALASAIAIPDAVLQDDARAAIASQLSVDAPEQSMQVIAGISDPTKRLGTVYQEIENVQRVDRPSANNLKNIAMRMGLLKLLDRDPRLQTR